MGLILSVECIGKRVKIIGVKHFEKHQVHCTSTKEYFENTSVAILFKNFKHCS